MQEYHGIVSSGGRVLIPSALRKETGLDIGEEFVIRQKGDEIRVISLEKSVEQAQKISLKYIKGKKVSLVDQLLKTRKEEALHE